jgi:hypothetical protein
MMMDMTILSRRTLGLLAIGLAVLVAVPTRGEAASCATTANRSMSCCVAGDAACCCRPAAPATVDRDPVSGRVDPCAAGHGCRCRADAPAAPGTKSGPTSEGRRPEPSKFAAMPRPGAVARPSWTLADPVRAADGPACPLYLRLAHLIL